MSLKIKKVQGVYQLSGALNATTSSCLINHINLLLGYEDEVELSIDGLCLIDQNGVAAFMMIMDHALKLGKVVHVSGNGFRDIYDEYRLNAAA